MKVSSEDLSAVEKRLVVEVEPEQVGKALDRAYRELSRRVSIKGFRPGRVPRRILEQHFKEKVEGEVREDLVRETLPHIMQEQGLFPVAAPRVMPDALSPGSPFRYQARIELRPQVELKDYRTLPFKPVAVEVTEAQIAAEVEKLRRAASQLVPVADRDKVMTGDFAVVDYAGFVDHKPFKPATGENATFEVSPGSFFDGHAPELAGARVGETREITAQFPSDFRITSVRGKSARFQMTVRSIKLKEAPALDDEFAKDLGAENLGALKARVREQLLGRAKETAEREERDQLVKILAERNPFEIPSGMVDNAVNVLIEGAVSRLVAAGVDSRRLDLERIRDGFREQAAFETRAALILEAVARQEKIEPSEEEIDRRIDEAAKRANQPRAKIEPTIDRASVAARLRQEKAISFLKSAALAERAPKG